ncbi:hypothetical protein PQR15_33600 [Streptomyces lydicus]|nr:hypothetical protein [Streptomyces lydicus]
MAVTVEPEQFDLGSVHSGLLDCIQVNLAVLADHHYGPGAHLRLGARLDFGSWAGADGLPTVDPPLTVQLTTATGLLGLRVASRERLTRGELLAALRKDGGVRYAVADAYLLPWLPYHRRAHMEHSFLMAAGPDGWHITDAYRSDTAWGTATPATGCSPTTTSRSWHPPRSSSWCRSAPGPSTPCRPHTPRTRPRSPATSPRTTPARTAPGRSTSSPSRPGCSPAPANCTPPTARCSPAEPPRRPPNAPTCGPGTRSSNRPTSPTAGSPAATPNHPASSTGCARRSPPT